MRFGYDDHDAPQQDIYGRMWENPHVQKPGSPYGEFPGLDRKFNISGPDTYREREEKSFMAVLTMTPIDELSIQLGGLYNRLEEETFGVNIGVIENRQISHGFDPDVKDDSFNRPPPFGDGKANYNKWIRHPEVDPALALRSSPTWDPYGLGPGEAFTFTRVQTNEVANQQRVLVISPLPHPDTTEAVPLNQRWWDPSKPYTTSGNENPTRYYGWNSWYRTPTRGSNYF